MFLSGRMLVNSLGCGRLGTTLKVDAKTAKIDQVVMILVLQFIFDDAFVFMFESQLNTEPA